MSDGLFDVEPDARPVPTEGLSADRRRTLRQTDALAAGQHPLAVALRWPLALHTDAAPADDVKAPGLRCGTCRFRELTLHNDYRHPKCMYGATDKTAPRETRGAGTDVRRWWPACRDYQPAEQVSP
jgi:hypothetical protein